MDNLRANAAHSESLGLPFIEKAALHERPLAVVGGGHSVYFWREQLKEYPPEDIWAINGTCQWLKTLGIDSTFFSIDPNADLPALAEGCERAILASHCHPETFEVLKGKDVRIFHAIPTPEQTGEGPLALRKKFGIVPGSTSACSAPLAALRMGYQKLTYYGCEGSFAGTTHTFKDEKPEGQLIVRAGEREYRTNLQFYQQSEHLAKLFYLFPRFFHERSGGLLRAMIEHPETWEVVAASEQLATHLTGSSEGLVPYAA